MSGMQRQFVLEVKENSNISPERSNTVNTHNYTNYTHEKSPETVISGVVGSVKSWEYLIVNESAMNNIIPDL